MKLGIEVELRGPDLLTGIETRTRNLQPAFSRGATLLRMPSSYTRPDRFVGGNRPPNLGPGYGRYQVITQTPEGLEMRFTRPFPPRLTEGAKVEMARLIMQYVTGG